MRPYQPEPIEKILAESELDNVPLEEEEKAQASLAEESLEAGEVVTPSEEEAPAVVAEVPEEVGPGLEEEAKATPGLEPVAEAPVMEEEAAGVEPAWEAAPLTAVPVTPPPVAAARPLEEKRAAAGLGQLVWFVAAVALGAILGAVAVLLILGGINGTLQYTPLVRGLRLTTEYEILTGQFDGLRKDLTNVQSELAALGKLPPQVDILSAELNTAKKGLADVRQELERVNGDVKGLSSDLKGVASGVETVGAALKEVDATVGKLGKQVESMRTEMEGIRTFAQRFEAFLKGLQSLLAQVSAGK